MAGWHEGHSCTSNMRRKTTTPSAKWVASKAIIILKQTPDMGPRDMQIKLQDDHNCVIGYDTVWRGLLGHRASSYKCELNGTKKRQVIFILYIGPNNYLLRAKTC